MVTLPRSAGVLPAFYFAGAKCPGYEKSGERPSYSRCHCEEPGGRRGNLLSRVARASRPRYVIGDTTTLSNPSPPSARMPATVQDTKNHYCIRFQQIVNRKRETTQQRSANMLIDFGIGKGLSLQSFNCGKHFIQKCLTETGALRFIPGGRRA